MSLSALRAVLEARRLRPLPRLILLVLADAVNTTNPERGAWPSVGRIMQRSGASHGAVCDALALLERHGWISVERRTGRSNRYRLTLPDPSASRTGDQSGRRTGNGAGPTRPPDGHPCPGDGHHPSARRTRIRKEPSKNLVSTRKNKGQGRPPVVDPAPDGAAR